MIYSFCLMLAIFGLVSFNLANGYLIPTVNSSEINGLFVSRVPENATYDTHIAHLDASNYPWQNYIDFYQFGNAPVIGSFDGRVEYPRMLIKLVIEMMDMLREAQFVITQEQGKPIPNNPSLLRYMLVNDPVVPDWLDRMNRVYRRLLAVIGTPPFDNPKFRQTCLPPLDKLQFWYGDPPLGVIQGRTKPACTPFGQPILPGTPAAYHFEANPGYKNGIAFCQTFFDAYKSVEQIDRNAIGQSFELGHKGKKDEPTYFTAMDLLHEMLHYGAVYRDQFTPYLGKMFDAQIVDPNTGVVWEAYRSFLAQRAKQWQWVHWDKDRTPFTPAQRSPMYNDDNWAYFAAEVYIKKRFSIPYNWVDSPDNR